MVGFGLGKYPGIHSQTGWPYKVIWQVAPLPHADFIPSGRHGFTLPEIA